MLSAMAACGSDPTSSASDSAAEEGPIKVGVALGLTGAAAATGSWARMGVELAAEQINADGGIDGRDVELVMADTELDPTKAVTAMNRLVGQEDVDLVIGPLTSDESLATLPIMTQAGIANINGSGSAITPEVAPLGFALLPNAAAQGERMVEVAVEDYDAKRIAIVHYNGTQGKVASASMVDALKERDMEAVTVQEFTAQSTDLTPQLLEIQASDPDVILTFNQTGADTGRIITGLRQLNSDVPVIGSYGSTFATQTKDLAGPDAYANLKAVTWPGFSACDEKSIRPEVTDFVTAAEDMFGDEPAWETVSLDYMAMWRDSLYLLAAGVEETGTTDGESVIKWLETEAADNAESLNLVHNGFAMSATNHFLLDTSSLALVDPGTELAQGVFTRLDCES
jgi:ABC-type branched-subunit amino acid transport system substrate-binding protein